MEHSKTDIKADFLEYLKFLDISNITLKNYLSDINHFSAWLLLKVRTWGILANSLLECIPYLSKELAVQYKEFLVANAIPTLTSNRRLSTLRHLGKFLLENQVLSYDFTENLNNLTSAKNLDLKKYLSLFEEYLTREKISKNTIKNYLSDIRSFLNWMEKSNSELSSKVN